METRRGMLFRWKVISSSWGLSFVFCCSWMLDILCPLHLLMFFSSFPHFIILYFTHFVFFWLFLNPFSSWLDFYRPDTILHLKKHLKLILFLCIICVFSVAQCVNSLVFLKVQKYVQPLMVFAVIPLCIELWSKCEQFLFFCLVSFIIQCPF